MTDAQTIKACEFIIKCKGLCWFENYSCDKCPFENAPFKLCVDDEALVKEAKKMIAKIKRRQKNVKGKKTIRRAGR
jgi:hypothetical protein